MIAFDDILKSYQNKIVLKNVGLELPTNKMITFIGPNGAGKSTLISVICRLMKKDSGSIIIDGKPIEKWDSIALAKQISILSQSNHMNVRLTVKDLVSFGRYPHSRGKQTHEDKKIIDDAINYMGISHLQNRFLDELSGGERQMAFIAMTIAQDAKYIVLDEPLNNLDMNHSVKIMKILKELVEKKGKTVLIVIHDINFVTNYADYIVAMKNGEILYHGDAHDVIVKSKLKDIYDLDIDVLKVDGNCFCMYYK